MGQLDFLSTTRFTTLMEYQNDNVAADWEELLKDVEESDFEAWRTLFVQLQLPIQEGISKQPEYREVTLKGFPVDIKWKSNRKPKGEIKLYLYKTLFGPVPVIEAFFLEDFEWLLQALAYRNEPRKVPESIGAMMLSGYNNWGRINLCKKRFFQENPNGNYEEYFKRLILEKEKYQDNILLLSHKPYSAVEERIFSLAKEDWLKKSLIIRREHEIAHLMTKRGYGVAQNNVHDEIIADFMGLTAAFEQYDGHYFLTFLGLENYPSYRQGGRLENYIKDMQLSEEEFLYLGEVICRAAKQIEQFYQKKALTRIEMFHCLCHTSVMEMAEGKFKIQKK